MTQEEALKLALDLATMHHTDNGYAALREKVRSAIKEALAQPEQEPLEYWNAVEGWVKIDEVREHFDSVGCGTIYKSAGEGRAPLYSATPQPEPVIDKSAAIRIATSLGWEPKRTWVGLTDEERKDIELGIEVFAMSVEDILKETEAKLKEKNT